MKPALEREIRERIEAFLSEISDLVDAQALSAVQEVFGAGAAARRARAETPAQRTRRPARREIDPEAVLAHVRAHEGQRIEQIAQALGVTSRDLKAPISALLASKAIRTQGQRRGTRYFARAAKPATRPQPRRTAAKRRTVRAKPVPTRTPRRRVPEAASDEAEPAPSETPEAVETSAQLEPSGAPGPALM